MYTPPSFREERLDVLHGVIRRNSFGTLVTQRGGELVATHIPFLLDPARGPQGTLLGHIARANPQWRSFADGAEALAIFQGSHAYISPSWYATTPSVPTWNYIAVHAYGVPEIVEGDALRAILEATVREFEEPRPQPWRMDHLTDDYVGTMMKAIVGFRLPICRLEGKQKLSQNRPEVDRLGAVAGLRADGDAVGQTVADLMASLPPTRAGR